MSDCACVRPQPRPREAGPPPREESGGRKVRGKEKDKGEPRGGRERGEVKVSVPGAGTGPGRRRGPSLLESGALGPARADSPACLQFSLFPGDSHFIFGKAACSVTNLFLNKPNPGGGEVGRGLSHSPPKGTTPQLWAWLHPETPSPGGPSALA